MPMFKKILFVLLGLFIVLNWGLLMTGILRKLIARVGKRIGMRVYQPHINLIKTYSIRSQISHGVMFYLGPVFRVSGGVGIFLFVPLIYGSELWTNFSFAGDLILVAYFMFFGMLGMALGAGEGGHPYSTIGVSRGLSQFIAIEMPVTLAYISLAIQYHTLSISEIVAAQQGGILNWTVFTNPFATIAGMIALIAATGHAPFNVVMAPQENPIGPPTEYHGTFLGVLQTNRAILHVMEAVLYMNLFFGGATNWVELIVKSFFVYYWTVFVGVVFPRFRVDQSIPWLLKIPTLAGIISILIMM